VTLRVLPDAELLTITWLQETDELAYATVFTAIPPEPSLPIVRVLRVGGSPVIRQHLDVARIQVDVWSDTKQEAHDLARLAQAAIHEMGGVHDEGVVTAIEDGVFAWNPDEPTGWAGYSFDVLVFLHPNPGVSNGSS
jgi:uncharacterized protein DUF3168